MNSYLDWAEGLGVEVAHLRKTVKTAKSAKKPVAQEAVDHARLLREELTTMRACLGDLTEQQRSLKAQLVRMETTLDKLAAQLS